MEDAPERPLTQETVTAPGGMSRHWIEAAKIVLVTRALLLLAGISAAWLLSSTEGPLGTGFFDLWDRWDSPLFARVAGFGYTDPQTDPHATAFFPLLPLAMRALRVTSMSYAAAGMAISLVATTVAAAFLHRWADEEVGEGSGRRAVLYMTLFPTAVFLMVPYSEALFLAGAVPAFYYARRGRWLMSALPAMIAVGARAAGLFLLFGLLFEAIRTGDLRRRWQTVAPALLIAASPVIAFSLYLWSAKGDAFYFFVDQREGWHREFTWPVSAFTRTLDLATTDGAPANWIYSWRLELVAAAIGVGFTIWALRKREWGYAAFTGSTMAALMTSTWYFSVPRMLLSLFPIYLLLATYTSGRDRTHEYLVTAGAVTASLGAIVYSQGAWFF